MTSTTSKPEAAPDTEAKPEAKPLHSGTLAPALLKVADDHQLPISRQGIHDWIESLLERHTSVDTAVKEFTDYARQMAMGMFPTLAPQIQQGLSVKTLLEPHRMVAKQVLGEGVEPNWAQPHWNKALTGTVDPATGRAAPMGLEHWRQELTSNPEYGYQNTDAGRAHLDSVLSELTARMHGFGGKE